MQGNQQSEKCYLKYLRVFFFFCSASFFPLSLISGGNYYIFKYLSVPLFSINSGFLFHKMVSKHVLVQLNRLRLNSAYITTATYYLGIYLIGIFWADLFVDSQRNIKINQYLFLFLPIINGLLFIILFGIRYFRLSLNSQFENIFDSQSSGLAVIDLTVRKMYDETLLKKNEMKKNLFNSIQQQKQINIQEIDSECQRLPVNNNIKEVELGIAHNKQSQSQMLYQNQNNFNENNSQIVFPQSPQEYNEKLTFIQSQDNINANQKQEVFTQQIFVHSRQSSQTHIPQNNNQSNVVNPKNESQIVNLSDNIEQLKQKSEILEKFRFANKLYDLKKKISMKIKKQEKDGNIFKKNDVQPKPDSPSSINENGLKILEIQQILEKNKEQFLEYQEIEQLLEELKKKGKNFYQMIYKLEMIQFSDILHMICVIITISINASIYSNDKTRVQSVQAFIDNKQNILIIFLIELILELIYTVLVTNLIGKIQDFYQYSFSKFMSHLFNFSRKQFLYIFASILCSYSILFIVINNQ
ncbi:hypothetical protein ABPG72_011625 [Tetrahymena utriculariae]